MVVDADAGASKRRRVRNELAVDILEC